MNSQERLNRIVDEVNKHGEIKISNLSRELGYAEVTLRNDIRLLDSQGLVKKIHGGATKVEAGMSVSFNPGKFLLNADSKKRIAQKAFELIRPNDTIALDDSSTGCYLARLMQEANLPITVVTNSLYAASLLSGTENVSLYILGGNVTHEPPSIMDEIAVTMMKQFHVNKAFIGVNGIDLTEGISADLLPPLNVKRAMIEMAEQVIIIADKTKFDNKKLFKVCDIKDINCIVTDKALETSAINSLEAVGVDYYLA